MIENNHKRHEFARNLAIIIGINEYKNPRNKLKLAVPDAKVLANFLSDNTRQSHWDGDEWYQVLLLTDKQATYSELNNLLDNLKQGKINFPDKEVVLQKDDRLLFYFSGHGLETDQATSQDNSHGLELLSQDEKKLNAETLIGALSQLPCEHFLLILDCCYSGKVKISLQKQQPVYKIPLVDDGRKTYREDYDRMWKRPTFTVITSAGNTTAIDHDNEQQTNSHFLTALLKALKNEGLNRKSDSNNDNIITAEEIYNYLVSEDIIQKNQQPEIVYYKNDNKGILRGQYFFLLPEFDPDRLKNIQKLDSPYKGLFAYEEKDEPIFCGRQELVANLFQLVNQNNQSNQKLTIITGASGSGKSSLVKAGLIPILRNHKNQNTKKWFILETMRPGKSPLNSLAKAILPLVCKKLIDEIETLNFPNVFKWNTATENKKLLLIIDDYNILKDEIKNENEKEQLQNINIKAKNELTQLVQNLQENIEAKKTNQIIQSIINWKKDPNQSNNSILLVVDQFEELITQSEQKEKNSFLFLLVRMLEETENLNIVLTVRSDFEIFFRGSSNKSNSANLNNDLDICNYWNNHKKSQRLPIPEMEVHQLREAIIKPVSLFINKDKCIPDFESEELVSRIINEVHGMPGALALLSFTLDELYKKAEKNSPKNPHKIILNQADYDDLGGVVNALTNRATKVYEELRSSDADLAGEIRQAMMKELILRMITFQGGKRAKRPVPKSELVYPNWHSRYKDATKRIEEVTKKLVDERLIVSDYYEETKDNEQKVIPYYEPAHDALILYWDKLNKNFDDKEETNLITSITLRERLIFAVRDWEQQSEKLQSPEQTKNPDKQHLFKRSINALRDSFNFAVEQGLRFYLQNYIQKVISQLFKKFGLSSNGRKSDDFLWTNDPRLEQIRQFLYRKESWLNDSETKFVRQSVILKGRVNLLFLGGITTAAIVFFILAILAYFGQREATIKNVRALRESAEADLSLNNDLEATLNVLRAEKRLKELLSFGLIPNQVEETELQATLHKVYYDVKERNRIQVNRGSVYGIALSPDDTKLATVGLKDNVTLWDTSNGKLLKPFKTKQIDVLAVAFHRTHDDNLVIATAGEDSMIKLWKIENNGDFSLWRNSITLCKNDNAQGKCNEKIKQDIVYSIAFINDEKIATLEVSSRDNSRKIKIWDISSKQTDSELLINSQSKVISFASKGGSNLLAIAGENNQISFCPITFLKEKAELCNEQQLKQNTHDIGTTTIESVAFDPDGNLVVVGKNGTVKLQEIENKDNKISLNPLKEISNEQNILYNVAVSKNFIATRGANFQVVLRDRYGKKIRSIEAPERIFRNNSVALSPNGTYLATASEDGYVYLWDSFGKPIRRILTTNRQNVRSVTFSPDPTQKLMLTGGDNKMVELWETSGNKLDKTPPQSSEIISVIFNPANPNQFASLEINGTYKLWKINGHKIQEDSHTNHTITLDKSESIKSIVFFPLQHNENLIVLALMNDGTIKKWKSPTEKPTDLLQNFVNHIITSFALTPDGKELVFGDKDGTVWRWNGQKEPVRLLETHQGNIDTLGLISNDKLVTVGEDGTLRIWDISNQRIQFQEAYTEGNTTDLCQVQDELNDYLKDQEKSKQGLSKLICEVLSKNSSEKSDIRSMAFSSDSTKLATVGEDGYIKLWDTSGNLLKHISIKPDTALSVAFSSNDNSLIVGSKSGVVQLLDINRNQNSKAIVLQSDNVTSLSWSSDNNLLATVEKDKDKTKTFWKGKIVKDDTGGSIQSKIQFDESLKHVKSAALSQNGTIATSDEDTIKVGTKNPNGFLTEQGGISNLALSSDGKLLATTGKDGSLWLWDSSGELFDQVVPYQGEDTSVVFSPNGKMLATIASNKENKKTQTTVKLWQISASDNKLRFFKTIENASKVAFSPDGKLLATYKLADGKSGTKGKIEIWQIGNTDELLAGICRSVENYLKDASISSDDRNLCNGVKLQVAQAATSIGEKILTPNIGNTNIEQEKTGLEAITNGDFNKAIEDLVAYHKQNLNDPEALIYLNNAKIGSQSSYTIAVSVPMSSNVNAALEILRGVAQSQNTINERGGINGRKLQVLIADDKDDPELAKQIANKFSKNLNVLGVIGHYASDTTLAAGDIYNKEKLPAISPVSTSVKLSGLSLLGLNLTNLLGRYTFRTVPSDKQTAQALAEYMRKEYPQSQAIVFYNSKSEYSNSLKNEFVNDIGTQISNKIDLSLSVANFDAVKSVREAPQRTVLVLMPNAEKLDDTLEVIEANAQRPQRLPMLAGDDVYSPKTLKKEKKAEGMVVAVPWHIDSHRDQPFVKSSVNLWGNRDVNWRTAMSYDATQALIAAIKQNPTREGVAQALRSNQLQIDNSATGKVSFSSSGDRNEQNIQLVQIIKRDSCSGDKYNFVSVKPDLNHSVPVKCNLNHSVTKG